MLFFFVRRGDVADVGGSDCQAAEKAEMEEKLVMTKTSKKGVAQEAIGPCGFVLVWRKESELSVDV